MALKHVQSGNTLLSEKVANQIIRYIKQNQLQEGDRLPNETVLGSRLNVSRSTIREAMKFLASRRIVEVKQGCGTFIAGMPGISEDPLGFEFIYNKEKLIFDLLEIRFILEPEIAAAAAVRAGQADIAAIKELADEVEKRINAGVNHSKPDINFHITIAKSTGNEVLTTLMPAIIKGVPLFIEMTKDRMLHETILTHRKIAQAIENHDADGARRSMLEHLQCNKNIIEDITKHELTRR